MYNFFLDGPRLHGFPERREPQPIINRSNTMGCLKRTELIFYNQNVE